LKAKRLEVLGIFGLGPASLGGGVDQIGLKGRGAPGAGRDVNGPLLTVGVGSSRAMICFELDGKMTL
jgi:hypothetical protein